MKIITILFFVTTGLLGKIIAQDTIRLAGILDGCLLCESIELYTESDFKWTSEYDLSWSEYGKYEISDQYLTLKFDESGGNRIKTYKIEVDRMYLLDNEGRKIKKIKDKSIRTKWSWIKNWRHKFYFIKQD